MKFVKMDVKYIDEESKKINELISNSSHYEEEVYDGWICVPFVWELVTIECVIDENGNLEKDQCKVSFSPETSSYTVNRTYEEVIQLLTIFEESESNVLEIKKLTV